MQELIDIPIVPSGKGDKLCNPAGRGDKLCKVVSGGEISSTIPATRSYSRRGRGDYFYKLWHIIPTPSIPFQSSIEPYKA
ncbi:unnamed protein product [Dovyalis caffra]|uniref:Uncharacterized protein n=1 Tax=Dovyalis caffra TaxID=77055 RepID=A0AAV1RPP5_9ROSI|nr:unnamed protein product [Dovyalis caffra]